MGRWSRVHFCGRKSTGLAAFGQRHFGRKLRIWQCIQFFIRVSTVVQGKRKLCLRSTPLNFWPSLHNARGKVANTNTPDRDWTDIPMHLQRQMKPHTRWVWHVWLRWFLQECFWIMESHRSQTRWNRCKIAHCSLFKNACKLVLQKCHRLSEPTNQDSNCKVQLQHFQIFQSFNEQKMTFCWAPRRHKCYQKAHVCWLSALPPLLQQGG